MLEVFENFVSILTNDPTTTGLVGTSIFTGPVDQTMETQASLIYPMIVLSQVTEVQRTVPLGVRDTQVQLDIWSRNDQLELENVYEAVIAALSYQSGSQGSAYIFWQRLGGAVDMFESERRIWHRACSFTVWSTKP